MMPDRLQYFWLFLKLQRSRLNLDPRTPHSSQKYVYKYKKIWGHPWKYFHIWEFGVLIVLEGLCTELVFYVWIVFDFWDSEIWMFASMVPISITNHKMTFLKFLIIWESDCCGPRGHQNTIAIIVGPKQSSFLWVLMEKRVLNGWFLEILQIEKLKT